MRNTLAIAAVIFIIAVAASSLISYEIGSSIAEKKTSLVNNTVTQLQYVSTTANVTIVQLVTPSPRTALIFTALVYAETLGVLSIETGGGCTVTILPVSTSYTSYTQYIFPSVTNSIGNSVFNATIITMRINQGELTTEIDSTYYLIPIVRTTESASNNLMQTYTLTLAPGPSLNTSQAIIMITSTCPEFTSMTTDSQSSVIGSQAGITITEFIYSYTEETFSVVHYVVSSSTYDCYLGTAHMSVTTSSSFSPIYTGPTNSGSIFTTVTITTYETAIQSTTTTMTGSYPLVTVTIQQGSSLTTSTECEP